MPEHHAKISPSSFKRVRLCPASLLFAQQFPNESSAAAEDGTACHEAVERMLDSEFIEPGFVAENGITITTEHMPHIEEVVEWIVDQEFDRVYTEVRLPIGAALGLNDPDLCWGTSDVIGIKGSAMYVVDAKFGFVPVAATGNDQAMMYLTGALHEIAARMPGDIDEMWNVILQPRAGGVKQAGVTWPEVHQFKKEAIEAIALANSSDAPFNPGEEQCRFCPASGSCRAQITAEFEDLEHVESPDALTDKELAGWLDKVDELIATAKAMKTTALARLAAGKHIPGWVREQGSGRARWIDEAEVIEEIEAAGLELDIFAPRKPATQGALKKALGAKVVEGLVYRPPGEPKLVRVEDARNPMDAEFQAIPED